MNSIARVTGFAPQISATVHCLPPSNRKSIVEFAKKAEKIILEPRAAVSGNYRLAKAYLSPTGCVNQRATVGLTCSSQVRFAHTDVSFPDFSTYRRDSVKDPTADSQASAPGRKAFTYVALAAAGVPATYATKAIVHDFVAQWNASADVLALAKLEVKLGAIAEGKNVTLKWRGKPLFVRHRTADEIAREQAVTPASLRDPELDSDRCTRPEWLIVLGVCTHLGCVPSSHQGEYGGYYCPCHGSHYDTSGRIRKGPAPFNLEVPPHEYVDDQTVIVG